MSKRYILMAHTVKPHRLDSWCRMVSSVSGAKVDWHNFAGRAGIFVEGAVVDWEKALGEAIRLMPTLRSWYKEALVTKGYCSDLPDRSFCALLSPDGRLIEDVQFKVNTEET
jgi:hypothetical protein